MTGKQGIVPTDEDYEAAREEIIGLIGDKAIHATIRHRLSNFAIYRAYTTPIDALYAEWAERESLRKWAFDQLERIVNAVKGEPEPLTSHSLHDVADAVEVKLAAVWDEACVAHYGKGDESVVQVASGEYVCDQNPYRKEKP